MYVGSADNVLNRLFNKNHSQRAVIDDVETKIVVQKYSCELDVAASRRQTLRAAANEAKRSVEEIHMRIEGAKHGSEKPPNNKYHAATAENSKIWKSRHKVQPDGPPTVLKAAGAHLSKPFGIIGFWQEFRMDIEQPRDTMWNFTRLLVRMMAVDFSTTTKISSTGGIPRRISTVLCRGKVDQ